MSKKKFDIELLKRYSNAMSNPFVGEFRIKANSFEKEGTNTPIGEGDDAYILFDRILYESDPFVRSYCSSDRRLHLARLSPRGHHLLNWIYQKIEYGIDLIWINRHAYMEESGIKRSETYVSAVADLVEYKLLSRAPFSVDVYWINPYFFFKGNRLKKYPEQINKEDVKLNKWKKK